MLTGPIVSDTATYERTTVDAAERQQEAAIAFDDRRK
jgi:hypothetical protein